MHLTPKDIMGADENQLKSFRDQGFITDQDVARAESLREQMIRGARSQQAPQNKTVVDRIAEEVEKRVAEKMAKQSMAGVGALPVPDVMQEKHFAGGGIVAFAGGEEVEGEKKKPNLEYKTKMAESNGDPNAIGPMTRYGTAKGDMQVLDMTSRDPGFGVVPARDNSKEERSRVGKDYLKAMQNRYSYDPYASLAYNWGPGNVDSWIKRGSNPNEIPKESRAYVIKTTGTDLGAQGPGGTYKSSRSAAPTAPAQPGIAGIDLQNKYRVFEDDLKSLQAEIQANNKEARARMESQIQALGPNPAPSDLAAIRKQALGEAAEINRPYLEKLNQLMEQGRPDTERMSADNRSNALIKAGLAMMQGRGRGLSGGLAAIAGGAGVGLESYEAGQRQMQSAQDRHNQAQILAEKSKFELAKGDKKYADELADAAVRQDRVAAKERDQALDRINSEYTAAMKAGSSEFRTRKDALVSYLRQMGADEKTIALMVGQQMREAARVGEADNRDRRAIIGKVLSMINPKAVGERADGFVSTPEYNAIKIQRGRAAADEYAREQAKNSLIKEALGGNYTPEMFQEVVRELGGLGGSTASAPASSATPTVNKGDLVFDPKKNQFVPVK